MTPTDYYNPLDVLDTEIPYPDWMEADLYGDYDDEPTPYENGNYMGWT